MLSETVVAPWLNAKPSWKGLVPSHFQAHLPTRMERVARFKLLCENAKVFVSISEVNCNDISGNKLSCNPLLSKKRLRSGLHWQVLNVN